MDADFAIELGRDDPALEIPWASADGPRYCDLKRHPDLLSSLEEARAYPELREFLAFINSPASLLESAKCDAWSADEINPEEEIFGAKWKFGSYVDLVFADERARCTFTDYEQLARRIVELLRRAPELSASAEFNVRRCYFHDKNESDSRDGFYITFYVFGFGADAEHARQRWAIALKLVENAIRQLLSTMRA